MNSYEEVLEYLYAQLPMYQRIGAAAYKNDLSTTLALDRAMDHPHSGFRSIHIAGTNGKGSVSHMLASVLQEEGYKTGLYTSPHLVDFRERIRVNGIPIPRDEVIRFVHQFHQLFRDYEPSFFEMTVAMAFWYFNKAGVDLAVIETGMGGRLDSTNIVIPVCSVITNIGLDHTRFLGDTLEKIAFEKAGIIKNGIPVVVGETQAETRGVFNNVASERNSGLSFADREYSVERTGKISGGLYEMKVSGWEPDSETWIYTDLGGWYQSKNLATVLKTIDVLKQEEIWIHKESVIRGLQKTVRNTGLLGRWQVLQENPMVVSDVGHNREGLTEVMNQLRAVPCKRLHLVFGMVNDKDPSDMLRLVPRDARYYFASPSIPRGLEVGKLVEAAHMTGISGEGYPDVKEALLAALSEAGEEDVVFIGGSTFVVADALASGIFRLPGE